MNVSAETLATVNDRLSNKVRSRIGSGCRRWRLTKIGIGSIPASSVPIVRGSNQPHTSERERPRASRASAHGDQQGAGVVGPVFALDPRRLDEYASTGDDHAETDRQIDPECRPPIGERDGERTEAGPAGDAERTDAAPHGDHLGATLQRERGEQQAERRRCQHGTADALDGSAQDQHAEPRRERGNGRAGSEDRQAPEEHPAAAQLIGHLAADQQQRAVEDVVRGDDPRRVGSTDVEVGEDVRERHVDDRQVERREEQRQRADRERDPRRPEDRRVGAFEGLVGHRAKCSTVFSNCQHGFPGVFW